MATKRLVSVVCASVIIAAVLLPGLSPARAQEQRLHVVASFSILADVVDNVAGDAADVETLIPRGQNPHAFAPSAQDVVTLSEADVVFVVGMNFEESLYDVVQESTGGVVYELWACLPIRLVVTGFEDDHDHVDEGDHSGDSSAGAGDDLSARCADHAGTVSTAFGLDTLDLPGTVTRTDADYFDVLGEADPHVWTDPVNVALWTLMIRDMLSASDPAHADEYAANADAYLAELAVLHAGVAALIDQIPADRRFVITNHLALNYFAARYGLTLVGVVLPGGGTGAEPSVREVLQLIETVQDYGVPAIFTETTVSDSLAEQIADEAGASLVPLYTGSLSASDGPASTYLDYMRFNATQIAEALQ